MAASASDIVVDISKLMGDFDPSCTVNYLYNKRRYVCLSVMIYVPYGQPNDWADRDQT